MDIASTDPQLVVDFYRACLTVLFWVSAVFACAAFLALTLLLWFEIHLVTREHFHSQIEWVSKERSD
jgi:hypothetical protein